MHCQGKVKRVLNMGKNKMGRPSKYSPEIIDKLCDIIATSGDGLHKICASDNTLPSFRTIFEWLGNPEKYPDFTHKYARAREAQADFLADEIIEISDDSSQDEIFIHEDSDQEGGEGKVKRVMNNEFVQRSRLRVDSRKWLMTKLAPKKYGEKQEITHAITEGQSFKIGDQEIKF